MNRIRIVLAAFLSIGASQPQLPIAISAVRIECRETTDDFFNGSQDEVVFTVNSPYSPSTETGGVDIDDDTTIQNLEIYSSTISTRGLTAYHIYFIDTDYHDERGHASALDQNDVIGEVTATVSIDRAGHRHTTWTPGEATDIETSTDRVGAHTVTAHMTGSGGDYRVLLRVSKGR